MPYADADLQSIDNFSIDENNRILIEEIEQSTLEREVTNREYRTDSKENNPNITNTGFKDESKGIFFVNISYYSRKLIDIRDKLNYFV